MLANVADWVLESTLSEGTGEAVLDGSVAGYIQFGDAFPSDRHDVWYSITSGSGDRELGVGVYDYAANTLTRSSVVATYKNGVYLHSALGDLNPIYLTGTSLVGCVLTADAFNQISQAKGVNAGDPTDMVGILFGASGSLGSKAFLGLSEGGTGLQSIGPSGTALMSDGTKLIYQVPPAPASVTSVGLTAPSEFTVGPPVTSTGNLTLAWSGGRTPFLTHDGGHLLGVNEEYVGDVPSLVCSFPLRSGTYSPPKACLGAADPAEAATAQLRSPSGSVLAQIGGVTGGVQWRTANTGFTLSADTFVDLVMFGQARTTTSIIKGFQV